LTTSPSITGSKMYTLKVDDAVDRQFMKLSKRDPELLLAIRKKCNQIQESPYIGKPLRGPLSNKRRVHIGSFVMIYSIDEASKAVQLLAFEHHDDAYA
jgi:mRNA-degrading endonuclease RelE of RelBE toxin-antitoxin system